MASTPREEGAAAVRLYAMLALIGIVALITACKGGGGNPATPPTAASPASGPLSVPTDPLVAELLSGDKVTLAQYEAAFFAYVACLDENGIPHGAPEFRAQRKPPRWAVTIGPYPQDQSEEVLRISDECDGRFFLRVSMAWLLQEAPTEAERQEMQQEVVECFNARTDQDLPNQDALWQFLEENQALVEAQVTYIFCMELIFEGVDHFSMQE